jgi:hypothetical protein
MSDIVERLMEVRQGIRYCLPSSRDLDVLQEAADEIIELRKKLKLYDVYRAVAEAAVREHELIYGPIRAPDVYEYRCARVMTEGARISTVDKYAPAIRAAMEDDDE